MNLPPMTKREPPPPHLDMDQYVSFVQTMTAFANPDHIRRQKEIEESDVKRFYFPEEDHKEGG